MRIVCREQHTAEWHAARVGTVTASGIARAMHFVDKGSIKRGDKRRESAADRKLYIRDLAWELITRVPTDHYVTKAMEIGTMYEGEARTEYWMATGQEVDQTGFVLHPTLNYLGCSPDGLIPAIKGVEVKVPLLKTHEDYLMADVVPEEYVPQMQCGMLCCELPEWDFVSYAPPEVYPEFPDDLRLFIKTLKADPVMHAQMEEAATSTMEEVIDLVKVILNKYPKLGPLHIQEPTLAPVLQRMVDSGYDNTKSFSDNCPFLDVAEMIP